MRGIAFIDLETNALPETDKAGNADFSKVRALQIAVVPVLAADLTRSGEIADDHFDRYILPEAGVEIDRRAAAVNGLSRDVLLARDARPESEVMRDAMEYLLRLGVDVLCGQNLVAFDFPIFAAMVARLNKCRVEETLTLFDLIDTKLIWKAWLLGMRRQPHETTAGFFGRVAERRIDALHSLGHIHRTLLGEDIEGAHGALADARATQRIFAAMIRNGIVERVYGHPIDAIL